MLEIAQTKSSNVELNKDYSAAHALELMRDKAAIPFMWQVLKGDDASMKVYAVNMLLNTCDSATSPTLSEVDIYMLDIFKKKRRFVGQAVVIAQRTKNIDVLLEIVQGDFDRSDYLAALQALSALHANSAVPVLESLVNNTSLKRYRRSYAADTLLRMTGKKYPLGK